MLFYYRNRLCLIGLPVLFFKNCIFVTQVVLFFGNYSFNYLDITKPYSCQSLNICNMRLENCNKQVIGHYEKNLYPDPVAAGAKLRN